MSHFTQSQDQALKELFSDITRNGGNPKLVSLIKNNNLETAVEKSAYKEIVIEDVLLCAGNEDIDLTRDEAMAIASEVISKTDDSAYHALISTELHKYIRRTK